MKYIFQVIHKKQVSKHAHVSSLEIKMGSDYIWPL